MNKRLTYLTMLLVASAVIVLAKVSHDRLSWHIPSPLKPVAEQKASSSPIDSWEGPVIYATLGYTVDENVNDYGIYAIDAATGRTAAVQLEGHVNAEGGGYYDNGLYRFVEYDKETDSAVYYEYRVSDWSRVKREELSDKGTIALDEAFDPATGNVYGCFIDSKAQYFRFGIVDHDTHTVTEICRLETPYFGMFVTPDGVVYGISSDGNLYKIDKSNGSRTLVGPTGVAPKYNQSAVCDLQTGKAYWLGCNTQGSTALYEVNLTTGKATRVRAFPKKEGLYGAIIAQNPYRDDAPDSVSDFKVDFAGSATSGNVSFTMPVKSVSGSALSGNIDYSVVVNNKTVADGKAAAGAKVTCPLDLTEGVTKIVVVVRNDAGYGRPYKETRYVGYDAPCAVGSPKAEMISDSKVKISWNAPEEGFNGGFFDPTVLSYKLVRMPGGSVVSSGLKKTSIELSLPTKEYAAYRYDIIPKSHGYEGPLASTNYVAVGPAATVPATMPASLKFVADNQSGLQGWKYDEKGDSLYVTAGKFDKKDIAVSPYVLLDGNYSYKVSLDLKNSGNSVATMSVKAGKTLSAAGMTIPALSSLNAKPGVSGSYETYIYTGESGKYHFGVSVADGLSEGWLCLNGVTVERGPVRTAPAMVSALTVKPGQNGADEAVVTFTTPRTDISGSPLSSLTAVYVYRNGERVGQIDNPATGAELSFTDRGVATGFNVYSVAAVNNSGEGVPTMLEAYVGQDVPGIPQNVRVYDTDGGVTISWSAPAEGVNGAYVDASKLRYDIIRSDQAVIGEGVTGTTITDDTNFGMRQAFVQYAVRAVSEAGAGAWAISQNYVVGEPFDYPFDETFIGGRLDNDFWAQEVVAGSAQWNLNSGTGADGESGYCATKPKAPGDDCILSSGKISMSGAVKPALSYSYYACPGASTTFRTSLRLPDGSEVKVDEVDFSTLDGNEGWRERMVDLKPWSGLKFVRVAFEVISRDGAVGSGVDEIKVFDAKSHDLAVSMTTVGVMDYNDTAKARLEVLNRGYESVAAGDYKIVLYKNDSEYLTVDGQNLAPFEAFSFDREFKSDIFDGSVKIRAEVVYDIDENQANNMSAPRSVDVRQSTLPAPGQLSGSVDGDDNVSLSWEEPSPSLFTVVETTDDVEAYESFIIDGVGEWTMVDRDGNRTFGIGDGAGSYHNFPYALDPKAFIVFNAPESGVEVYDVHDRPTKWAPHSGDQMFVSFQASGTASDDWMISPRLSGKAQTISFFVRSVDPENHEAETYEVLYSTTGNNPDDFIEVPGSRSEAPGQWTEVTFDLPYGAKYFAIHGISFGGFALMIDDISYSPADYTGLEIAGYNLYCNRVRVNEAPLTSREFRGMIHDRQSVYQVSAVYDCGESKPSNAVTLNSSGIGAVFAGDVRIFASEGRIVIDNVAGEHVDIAGVDGVSLYSATPRGDRLEVKAHRGVYVVRAAGRTAKLIVK